MTLTVDDVVLVALTTLIAAAIGGLAGSWLTLKATTRTIEAQKNLAEEDREAQEKFAAEQRNLDQREQRTATARNAAAELLEPVAVLRKFVPRLPALGESGSMAQQKVTPLGALRAEAREALDSYKLSMSTALLRLNDEDLASRCRELWRVASDLAYGGIEPDTALMNRAQLDVENYIRYILISLKRFMDGEPSPEHTAAPYLKRKDGSAWHPQGLQPDEWDQM